MNAQWGQTVWRLHLSILVAMCFSNVLAIGDDWPGWRGLEQCGQRDGEGPRSWSATHGVKWKTAIPGRGHSSPIISDDSVIVTTAYSSRYSSVFQRSIAWFTLILALGVTSDAVRSIFATCRNRGSGRAFDAQFIALIALGNLILIIVALTLFADNVFNYARCPIRSWLGSSVTFSALVFLVGIRSKAQSSCRGLLGMLLLLFACFVVAAIPANEHAFRSGLFSQPGAVVFGTASLPLLGGLLLTRTYLRARTHAIASGRQRNSAISFGLALLAVTVMFAFVTQAYQVILGGGQVSVTVPEYRPLIAASVPFWLLCVTGVAFVAASCAYSRIRRRMDVVRSTSDRLNVLMVIRTVQVASGTLLTVLVAILIVNRAVEGSDFLIYHVGSPDWTPTLGRASLIVTACVFVCVCISSVVWAATRDGPGQCEMSFWTIPAGLLVACLVFGNANYLRANMRLVHSIVSLDRRTGQFQWKWEGLASPQETVHVENSQATPTPLLHGEKIYGYFGAAGLVCINDCGETEWEQRSVSYHSCYGVGASPVLRNGVLVIVNDMPLNPYVVAIQSTDGSVLWRKSRFADIPGRVGGHSRTPLILPIDGRDTILVWGWGRLEGYDLQTGEMSFSYAVEDGGDCVASLIADERNVYLGNRHRVVAVSRSQLGAAECELSWECRANVNCVTPVVSDGRLYAISDAGILVCIDTATGQRLWRERLPGEYRASPVAIGELVYFCNTSGRTTVLRNAARFERIAVNDLDESVVASFGVVSDRLIVRSEASVYCVEDAPLAIARQK